MTKRRDFIKKGALVTAGIGFAMKASSYNSILGANDRINLGFMGLGRRAPAYIPILNDAYNTKLLYLCDVKKSQVTSFREKLKEVISYKYKEEEDIRLILEDKKLDAVFIAAPDHWHTPAAVMAMDAGKHVYIEKPCAHNPREGEILVERQKSTGKHVQMGNQQRSSTHTIDIIKEIKNGIIGEPYRAVAFYNNIRGEVPQQIKQAPPIDLNWDLFQGPAPRQDYFHDIWNYNWHWYGWKWGTAETGNNAVHELDVARWAMGLDFPEHVSVEAGKNHFINDGWEMYDDMYATFKFSGSKVINWDGKSRNGYNTYGAGRGTIIYGSEGTVIVDRGSYKLHDRSGKLVKESEKTDEGGVALGGGGDTTTAHAANLLGAIRGKETLNAPIADAVKSNHMALLANLSYRTGKSFTVDSQSGKTQDTDVNKLWSRSYEAGWEVK